MRCDVDVVDGRPAPTKGFAAGGAFAVFAALLAVYQADPSFLFYQDTEINAFAAVTFVERGEVTFSSDSAPWALEWEVAGPAGSSRVPILVVDDVVDSLRDQGILQPSGETYLVRQTVWPDRYASTFGWGVWISATPVFAALSPWIADPATRHEVVWRGAKLAASMFVAGSAGLVFLTAARFVPWVFALIVALAYGLGTNVWSTTSQTLWQHAPSEFSLALGTYALIRSREGLRYAAACGAAYAWATWCRQPSAVAVIAAGGYFLLCDRRALLAFLLAGLPFAIGMFGLNWFYHGSPFHFGELVVPELAVDTTGQPEMWQTPLWLGLAGVLFSPSRGMFVYSPFLIFAIWGACEAWKRRDLVELRPLSVSVLLLWGVHAHYYDWWGGYSYGYRQVVDSTVFLSVLMAPILPRVCRYGPTAMAFGLLLAWSVAVQAVGAWSFDIVGWNAQRAVVVGEGLDERIVRSIEYGESLEWEPAPGSGERLVELAIDNPKHRGRMWSLADTQIDYYFRNFWSARRIRKAANSNAMRTVEARTAETYRNLIDALRSVGRPDAAFEVQRRLDEDRRKTHGADS